MSPVIAFDIAVVAQKVKVQCCYIMAFMLNLKKWSDGGAVVIVVIVAIVVIEVIVGSDC